MKESKPETKRRGTTESRVVGTSWEPHGVEICHRPTVGRHLSRLDTVLFSGPPSFPSSVLVGGLEE